MSPCHRKSETQLDSELSLRLKLYECSMGCTGRPLGNFRRLERLREFEPKTGLQIQLFALYMYEHTDYASSGLTSGDLCWLGIVL